MEGETENYYYAVHKGLQTGVFNTWGEVEPLVKSFRGAKFKKFSTREEALEYVKSGLLFPSTITTTKKRDNRDDEISDSSVYHIFTDGARSGATKRCGVGVAFDYPLQACAIAKRLPDGSTHQKAELDAIVSALWSLKNNNDVKRYLANPKIKEVHIWTDSQYGCDCFTLYIHQWRQNGWQTSSSQPVKHQKIIEQGAALLESMPNIKLRHISEVGLVSHQKKVDGMSDLAIKVWHGNRRADDLASGK
jgi:ribonuclease HI